MLLGSPVGEVWDACAAGDFASPAGIDYFFCPPGTWVRLWAKFGTPVRRAISPSRRGLIIFSALRALGFACGRSLGRLCGGQQGGAGYGAAPPPRPPLHSPRSTPLGFPYSLAWRGQRGFCCGSFLPSRRSLRRSPSAPRKCHTPLALRLEFRFSQIPAKLYKSTGSALYPTSSSVRCCPVIADITPAQRHS